MRLQKTNAFPRGLSFEQSYYELSIILSDWPEGVVNAIILNTVEWLGLSR